MDAKELLFWGAASYGAALVAFAARITFVLGLNPDPPPDTAQRLIWQRRRRWLVVSEFAALPLFASVAVLAVAQGWIAPITGVLFSLLAGAMGFAFFLHALDTVLRRRIGMNDGGKHD